MRFIALLAIAVLQDDRITRINQGAKPLSWVKDALEQLSAGRPAQVRPWGGSMRGRIEGGQQVTFAPVESCDIRVDDVVFVRWKGGYLLHLVKEIRERGAYRQQPREDQRLGF